MRTMVYATLAAATLFIAMLALKWHWLGWVFLVLVPLWCIAIYDSIQQEHSLRRNFPLIGRGRWLMELRNGPQNLDTRLSEISLGVQAALSSAVCLKYTASGVRRPIPV